MTFSIHARSNGRTLWLRQGDAISIEYPDGKGVSARIADVSIAPGGIPFSIICTDSGQWPEERPEFAPGEPGTYGGSIDPGDDIEALRGELRRVTIERDLARERVSDLAQMNQRRMQQARDAERARDEWRTNARMWEEKAHTLEQMGPGTEPIPRTVVVNVPENGTLVVNNRG